MKVYVEYCYNLNLVSVNELIQKPHREYGLTFDYLQPKNDYLNRVLEFVVP